MTGHTPSGALEQVERDIRTAIWNAGMNGGMGQDLTLAFIRRAMAERCMVRALAALDVRATPGGDFVVLPREEARKLLDDLNARIELAVDSVPVFPGIAALHDALATPDADHAGGEKSHG